MHKLLLIDGNSLLNRAYYATKLLTDKNGYPTNAIFGFTKLLLKLIEDIKPTELVVAFDVKEPTFRHKLDESYKGTRKGMPQELAVQIDRLKNLLQLMQIKICEEAGYEADDILGTLSKKFKDTKSIIISGDRDCYQLVDENTDVYITKTGVSELLKLNLENFEEVLGYQPYQTIELKALMGDNSDNISGVPGVGEKTAFSLIEKYKTVENIYNNLENISGALHKKLAENQDKAMLSKQLATIDRDVPLDITIEECSLKMPFSHAVKKEWQQMDFKSLLKLDIFEDGQDYIAVNVKSAVIESEKILEHLLSEICSTRIVAIALFAEKWHMYAAGQEYIFYYKNDLLSHGLSTEVGKTFLQKILNLKDCKVLLYNYKANLYIFEQENLTIQAEIEDIALIKYLVAYSGYEDDFNAILQLEGFDENFPAYAIMMMYTEYYTKLEKEELVNLYKNIELPLAKILFLMEKNGVKVDNDTLVEFEKYYKTEYEDAMEKIVMLAGEKFNVNSPAQLGSILFEKLKLPYGKKNKNGKYATSADILEKLAPDYAIVSQVLRMRQYQKLLSTYIEPFKNLQDKDALLHTTFNQVQTSTGRLSSLNPNLQNIPVRDNRQELRKLFIPRAKDRLLIAADYSQIELRLLAHLSKSPLLIAQYQNAEDIHRMTASQIFELPLDKVDSNMRAVAKSVNFGIIYGMSAFGLANNLNISNVKAGEYIKRYFEKYPEVKTFMEENVKFAKETGYVKTIMGRKRYIQELQSSNFAVRQFGERAAMNMPLQGSSADIIKLAMVNVYNRMLKNQLKSQLILQIHDELVIDVYKTECDIVQTILREEMEGVMQLAVPLVVNMKIGSNWYETK